jgi:hypothetical protein
MNVDDCMDTEKENSSNTAASNEESWARGLLLPAYFLLLLAIGIWLLSGAKAPDILMVVYALVLVTSIVGLFFRKNITFSFDRRNYIDFSRHQWFGRRERSNADNKDR